MSLFRHISGPSIIFAIRFAFYFMLKIPPQSILKLHSYYNMWFLNFQKLFSYQLAFLCLILLLKMLSFNSLVISPLLRDINPFIFLRSTFDILCDRPLSPPDSGFGMVFFYCAGQEIQSWIEDQSINWSRLLEDDWKGQSSFPPVTHCWHEEGPCLPFWTGTTWPENQLGHA